MPGPTDTTRRVPGDTLRRPARTDTVRAGRDSVTIAVPIPDSSRARIDSIPGVPDSLATRRPVRDSIKAPIARAELPASVEIAQPYRWTRDSLFATGTLTALDLLERVPGLTGFRSGWLASAQTAAYLGDFRRLRVFRDGVEMDPVDPRTGGILDLPDVQLWNLDEVLIERTAGEVRVHLRTWTVRNTTPYTRVDVGTGDEDTNLYRGFYGKRFQNGGVLQIGADRFGTGARNARRGGGGDATSIFSRFGWSRGQLSIDALLTRVDRGRSLTRNPLRGVDILRGYEGRRDEGYLRVGYGDPDAGPWVQGVANALGFTLGDTTRLDSVQVRRRIPGTERDTTVQDTVRVNQVRYARTQYVLAGGLTRWGVRLSATDRYRVFNGQGSHSPALRAAYELPWLSAAAYAERGGIDSTRRVELTTRVQPLPWLSVLAAYTRTSRERPDTVGIVDDEEVFLPVAREGRGVWRAEVGARLGRLWLTAGRIARDAGTFAAPLVYADSVGPAFPLGVRDDRATGTVFTARGRIYKDVRLDLWGTAWDAAGLYRPQYQARAELRLETNWLSRFPTGNFGFVFAVVDEYRSRTPFALPEERTTPTLRELCAQTAAGANCAAPSNVLNVLVELRILQGTAFYQLRNALNRQYELVPGLLMPGPINFYGVRWNFFN